LDRLIFRHYKSTNPILISAPTKLALQVYTCYITSHCAVSVLAKQNNTHQKIAINTATASIKGLTIGLILDINTNRTSVYKRLLTWYFMAKQLKSAVDIILNRQLTHRTWQTATRSQYCCHLC